MKTEWIIALSVVLYISRGELGDWPERASTIRNQTQMRSQPHVRPEELTVINITFVLTSLNKLSTVSQELSTTFLLHMRWYDPRLAWNRELGDPEYLVFYVNEVWTPPLVVSNAVEDDNYLLRDNIVPVQVSSNGTVIWAPSLSPLTTCEINIAKFPVDEQTCYISITTWVHSTSELDLRETGTEKYPDTVTLEQDNDKAWKLHDPKVISYKYTGVSGIEFKMLKYTLKFTRHQKFYMFLLIVPFCCIALLMPFVLLIPPKHQAPRVAFSVTLMLAFQVYLNQLQRLLPPVFDNNKINWLGEFASGVMIYGTLITLFLVIELFFHYCKDKCQELTTVAVYGCLQATNALLFGKIKFHIDAEKVEVMDWCVSVFTSDDIIPIEIKVPKKIKDLFLTKDRKRSQSTATQMNNADGNTHRNTPGNNPQRTNGPAAVKATLHIYRCYNTVISSPAHLVPKVNNSGGVIGLISIHFSGIEGKSGDFEGQIFGTVSGHDIRNCNMTGTFKYKCNRKCKLRAFAIKVLYFCFFASSWSVLATFFYKLYCSK